MLTMPIAQLSLAFGVDDLDGTVEEEKIIHAAGAKTNKGITKQEIIQLVSETGYIPVAVSYTHLDVYKRQQSYRW